MRNTFIKNLIEAARKDSEIYFLTADLGFKAFESFRDEFPGRFINVGVAEVNMIGIAAGLALSGKKVFVHSIVPFATLRCLEQIRNDICYHDLNVKIVATGGGFNYGNQGFSHNTTEDLAIMRALPNMTVLCPADVVEAGIVIKEAFKFTGPAYIRLGKTGEREVYNSFPEFSFGKGLLVNDGTDMTLISVGNIIDTVLEVSDNLKQKNISVRIISMPCLKPIDEDIIKKAAQETKAIFTIEEHSEIGGLGSAVSEILKESEYSNFLFKKFALQDKCYTEIGSHKYLKQKNGLGSYQITEEILKLFNS